MGFLNSLTIVFVIAKLFGVIDWSWLLVFSPTIVYLFIAIIMFIIYIVSNY